MNETKCVWSERNSGAFEFQLQPQWDICLEQENLMDFVLPKVLGFQILHLKILEKLVFNTFDFSQLFEQDDDIHNITFSIAPPAIQSNPT